MAVIGVLALQGDVREHVRALEESGATAKPVRRLAEIESADGLVIPGGESTTLWKLATAFDLLDPVRKIIADGMPAFGSCAGLIMLADRLRDGVAGQQTFGGIDMTARRNAFGRQVDSFERDVLLRLDADGTDGTAAAEGGAGAEVPPVPTVSALKTVSAPKRWRRSTRCSSGRPGWSKRARKSPCSARITVGSSPSGRVRFSRPRSIRN